MPKLYVVEGFTSSIRVSGVITDSNTFNLLEKLCQKLGAHVTWAGGREAQQ